MCKSRDCSHNKTKLYKFGDFILENKVAKLVLEGNLTASQKFLSRLSSIRENPIADTLYKAFSTNYNIEKDLSQNWVDVTNKEDVVSFMADRGAARLNNDPETVFSAKGRNEIKVGRFARAILSELGQKVVDKDIEVFVNTYKASGTDNSKRFELVNGPIIKKYYSGKNYTDDRGTLGDSCMRGDDCQNFFKLYTKNTEQCQLLVYLDENGKVLGRALVWKLSGKELFNFNDQKPIECPAEYFMDRVYTSKDSDVIKFINYAKEKGWLYKWKMTADNQEGLIFKYDDKVIFGRIIVKLPRVIFRKYPFVDTLNFCNGDDSISNVGFIMDEKDEDAEEGFEMCDTDGGTDTCSNCDGTGYDPDDRGNDCRKCDGDGEINCPECRGGGEEICKKCDGNGDIPCNKCDGDGNIDCSTCNGRGDVKCKNCNGEGEFTCEKCKGKGDLGKCTNCNGKGDYVCTNCKGEPLTCSTCNGEQKISKKWGRGVRTMECPGCGGVGKAKEGERDYEGCKCDECSDLVFSNAKGGYIWKNTGVVSCRECEGDGEISCDECGGWNSDPGKVSCDDCNGGGEEDCPDCRYGSINCPKCDGDGEIGQCDVCKGKGKLGECKSPICKNGVIECSICKGSGERPKGQGKTPCEDCAGIIDRLKEEIKSGEFKLR